MEQKDINKIQNEINQKLEEHAKVANEEMGVIKEKIIEINGKFDNVNTHINWIREAYETWEKKINKIDDRVWWILATVVLGALLNIGIQLALALFKQII